MTKSLAIGGGFEVTMGENPYKGDDFPMYVAKRDAPSERIIF